MKAELEGEQVEEEEFSEERPTFLKCHEEMLKMFVKDEP